jgi:hypothetical protein
VAESADWGSPGWKVLGHESPASPL